MDQHHPGGDESKCPVSPEARKVWLEQNKKKPVIATGRPSPKPKIETCSSDSEYLDPANNMPKIPEQNPRGTSPALSTEREVSTIPRADTDGKWIYPSQQMFFNAMQRKNWDPNATDMQVVVPIHNAVNERAWAEILDWESGKATACGGPKLVSFEGKPTTPSPKARIKSWLGYTKPFDRHDWVVDRCGTKITYVIDFYQGRAGLDGRPSFYLDVRPALSPLGVYERLQRAIGVRPKAAEA